MAYPLVHTQQSFEGGMNLVSLGTRVQSNEYILGINLRSRFGYCEPVMKPLDITGGLPTDIGIIQGLYAFGEILIAFVSGQAWYQNAGDTNAVWIKIENFALSAAVTRIYTCGVPVSSNLYLRKNAGTSNSPNDGVVFDANSANGGTPICLVCQDGINQPWLIFPDGTSRVAVTYAQWDINNREYIPIGKQMVFFNGALYIVDPEGKQVYRSVSGRPLDFVIAVDKDGNKVADASVTSIAADHNEIKLIATLNSDSLILISAYSAWLMTPDFTPEILIYGEPQFDQTFLFTAGTINQFCWTDLLGDFAFIDREGLKSFNAVQQTKFEGNNSVFSLGIAKVFKGLVQNDDVCVGSFDNYAFFAVKTVYSTASIVVYDAVKQKFVSIDLLSSRPIKQFATTYSAARQRFFACSNNKIFELYSINSLDPLPATIFTREIDSISADQQAVYGLQDIKCQSMSMVFEEGLVDGKVYVDEIVNSQREDAEYSKDIPAFTSAFYYPLLFPMMATVEDGTISIDFSKRKRQEGQKIGFALTWTGGARLTNFTAYSDTDKGPASIQQQGKLYK